mgnify:CR=1 FL=1
MVLDFILGPFLFLWCLLWDLRHSLVLGTLESGLGDHLKRGHNRLWLILLIWTSLSQLMITMGKETTITILTHPFLSEVLAGLILFSHNLAWSWSTWWNTWGHWSHRNHRLKIEWFDDRLLRWLLDHVLWLLLETLLAVCWSWLLVILVLLATEIVGWIVVIVIWLVRPTTWRAIGVTRVVVLALWGLMLIEEAVVLLLVG